jgi:GntR family transcriptional regulator of bglA
MVKYKEIAHAITQYIEDNDLQQHDKLPVIDALAAKFQASKSTIIKALDILEAKGQIYQVQGSGIFVRELNLEGFVNLNRPNGLSQSLHKGNLSNQVIEVSIIKPTSELVDQLACEADEDIYLVKRVRYITNKPIAYEISYYRKKYIKYMDKEIAAGSIFRYLKEHLNIDPGFSNAYFKMLPLDAEAANYLAETPGTYGLKLINQFFLPNGTIFDYSITWYQKDRSEFFVPSTFY